jgi:hypothetical protein
MTTNSKHDVSVSSIFALAIAFRFETLLSVLQQQQDHADEWRHCSPANVL